MPFGGNRTRARFRWPSSLRRSTSDVESGTMLDGGFVKHKTRLAKAAVACALLVVIGAPLTTVAAKAGREDAGTFSLKPASLTGQAPCHPGKSNGFRLYCRVAVNFTLDARKFSFKGGSCGHGHGQWGFSAGPGAVTIPAKGWTLSVHFGFLDYGKSVNGDGKYGRANGYDDIHVSMNLKAGTFVPPESALDVVVRPATVSLSSGMTRGSYRAHVAWVSTAKSHLLVGTFRCW
jgi:hypothetical protein